MNDKSYTERKARRSMIKVIGRFLRKPKDSESCINGNVIEVHGDFIQQVVEDTETKQSVILEAAHLHTQELKQAYPGKDFCLMLYSDFSGAIMSKGTEENEGKLEEVYSFCSVDDLIDNMHFDHHL